MLGRLLACCAYGLLMAGCGGPAHSLVADHAGVEVVLRLPEAKRVQFASSRDGFAWHDTRQRRGGDWVITVPGRGEFRYFYLADGALFVPDCHLREGDDFGRENCIYSE